MKEYAGAEKKEQRGQKRAGSPDPAPVEPCRRDRSNASQGRNDTCSRIANAKQEKNEGIGMEQEGPMHHWIVLIAAGTVKIERVVGVQTLVVAHPTRAKCIKAADYRHDQDGCPGYRFPVRPHNAQQA